MPDRPGIAGRIFGALGESNVNVDMIVQNEPVSEGARADISFTVPRADVPAAQGMLDPMRGDMLSRGGHRRGDGDVSIIGAGMKSHPGVAAKVFGTLGEQGINIEMISTSPIKISCVIRGAHVARAVHALHAAFDLGTQVRAEAAVRGAAMSGWRVAVVGATGAVGTAMLEFCASATSRRARSSPSPRRGGGPRAGRRTVQVRALVEGGDRASTWRSVSAGSRGLALSGRRGSPPRARW